MNTGPIKNLDAFDVVGKRKDGGIDLVISCHGPLDGSVETQTALKEKLQNYVREVRMAESPSFFDRYKIASDANINIFISCKYDIDPIILRLIDDMQKVAAVINARIVVRKNMG